MSNKFLSTDYTSLFLKDLELAGRNGELLGSPYSIPVEFIKEPIKEKFDFDKFLKSGFICFGTRTLNETGEEE